MKLFRTTALMLPALLLLGTGSRVFPAPSSITLQVLTFDETRDVKFGFRPSPRVGEARLEARVKIEGSQSWIELKHEKLRPAVLFAGDVTCYAVWAINRDGDFQNLGELFVEPGSDSGSADFSTGLRNFALIVTAESYAQADSPSAFVVFTSDGKANPPVRPFEVTFDRLVESPRYGVESLANVQYAGKKPIELLQAETVFGLAEKIQAEKYAGQLFAQARTALAQSTQMYRNNRKEGAARYARGSTASSSEAIRLTKRRIEMEKLEQEIAARQKERDDLEKRAHQAEEELATTATERQAALADLKKTQDELGGLTTQLSSLREQKTSLESQKAGLERQMADLRTQQEQLKASMKDLEVEKQDLQGRLQSALSKVADTQASARGFIVSLPDILFDIGKADLKPEAELALAKLAGILLLMTDLNVRVEGHTDSTGSPEFNLQLSKSRADSVLTLLASQGVPSSRISTAGYGMTRPLADNATADGRKKNRRVEIIIAEGTIAEQ